MAKHSKNERRALLEQMIAEDLFLTDEEIAERLNVSVPTIRLDRASLSIPEYRKRIKATAEANFEKVSTITSKEIVGELVDIVPNESAISILETDKTMVFENTLVVKGQYLYSMAETLAMASINAKAALVGVANIKYKKAVTADKRVVAKAQVRQQRGNKYIVWVNIFEKMEEVFRGKFI